VMRQILNEQDYSFYEDDKGDLWIQVVCGSIGLYEVMVKLLPEEVEQYKSDPGFLKYFSHIIARDPEKYEKR
jgi:hypothetical protein